MLAMLLPFLADVTIQSDRDYDGFLLAIAFLVIVLLILLIINQFPRRP